MATIKTTLLLPWLRHCQGEAHTHMILTRGGRTARSGRGLGFWFGKIGNAISEVPVNAQSVAMSFKARSKDFQDVAIAGQVWYRVTLPELTAQHFDFSLDTQSGEYKADPLTIIQGALVSAAQEAVWSFVSRRPLEELLGSALTGLGEAVASALAGLDFGIEVERAVVTSVRPERTVEQALQAETRERLQMQADAAGFDRRAKATDKERAIQEAELANKLALARKQTELITQNDANARAEAESEAAVRHIEAASEAKAQDIRDSQEVGARRERDSAQLENKRALTELRLEETERGLEIHDAKQDAARVFALTQLPKGLANVRVLTIGEGGLQSALERIAGPSE